MATWLLFIDESGSFDEPSQPVLVGGWLVRAYDTPQLRDALERRVREAHPHVPWPPHAAHLDVPVFHAAAFRLAGPKVSAFPRGYVDACVSACATLERGRGRAFDAFRAALAEGRKPAVDVLHEVDRWLARTDRASWDALREIRRREDDRRISIFSALGAVANATRSFAVGAFAPATDSGSPGGERYLELLTAVFERAMLLASSAPTDGGDVIWAHVARRSLETSDGNLSRMTLEHILQAAARAKRNVGDASSVLVLPRDPATYDAPKTHPGLMVADAIATRLRRIARASVGWKRLRGDAELRIGLAVEDLAPRAPSAGPLPSLACDGLPRAAIASAFAGGDTTAQREALSRDPRPWSSEQAVRWMDAAARWTR